MNRIQRGAIGLTVAAGLSLGFYEFVDSITPSTAEVNAIVDDCASHLGEVAVTTNVLPADCPDINFDQQTTTVMHYKHNGGGNDIVKQETVYELPTAEQYRHDHYTDPDQLARVDQIFGAMGIAVSLLSGVTIYRGLPGSRKA